MCLIGVYVLVCIGIYIIYSLWLMQPNNVLQLLGHLVAEWDLVFGNDCGGQTFERRVVD